MRTKKVVHYIPQKGDGTQNFLPACGRGSLNTTLHSEDMADVTCLRCLQTPAAPPAIVGELVAACKDALVYVQSDPAVYPLICQLRAAIAKAEGGAA
jgi:hypothetical protein